MPDWFCTGVASCFALLGRRRDLTVDPAIISESSFFSDPDHVLESLAAVGYLADERIATAIFVSDVLGKPLLCEGPAGVGKTELAKSIATATGRRLIRLQCYEGLDESKALYEWNYKKQLLRIQTELRFESECVGVACRDPTTGFCRLSGFLALPLGS